MYVRKETPYQIRLKIDAEQKKLLELTTELDVKKKYILDRHAGMGFYEVEKYHKYLNMLLEEIKRIKFRIKILEDSIPDASK